MSRPFARMSVALARRPSALLLELLEERDCPSAPTVTNFAARILSSNTVVLTGNVGDDHQNTLTVNFSGAGSLSSTVALGVTNTGQFAVTLNPDNVNGTFFAQAVDDQQATSATVQTIAGNAPTLTVAVNQQDHHNVYLRGTVDDNNAGNLTVTFSGVVSGTATTDANGNYGVVLTASALGNIQATTTNGNGTASNTAQATLTNLPPVIDNFTSYHSGNNWTFTGHVTDEWAMGLIVTVNVPGLNSPLQIPVGNDDCFSTTVTLNSPYGPAFAQTTDWWGATSNQAERFVQSGNY